MTWITGNTWEKIFYNLQHNCILLKDGPYSDIMEVWYLKFQQHMAPAR